MNMAFHQRWKQNLEIDMTRFQVPKMKKKSIRPGVWREERAKGRREGERFIYFFVYGMYIPTYFPSMSERSTEYGVCYV